MTNRFVNPFPQFFDSTPRALVGAKLFFYQSGNAVKLNTYQRRSLTGPANANPVVLNAAGRSPVNIFLQDLAYRVVLAPATDTDPPTSPIWVADPVYASDFSTTGAVQTFPGNPNGFVAGTAGSGDVPADLIFDTVNNILYVATTTGNAVTTVWTAINVSPTVNVPMPQGRLTLTTLVPVITSDVVATSTVFYTPYNGNLCPIYNGTTFTAQAFSEQTLSLVAAHAASNLYDVFAFMNGSTFTIGTGPAWNNSGAGTGSRGAGAGTTQLTMLNGVLVNAVQITARNGANTFVVPANTATYLGSIFMDSTNALITCHTSYGQSRKWGVWNAYNRKNIILRAGDGTASWPYTVNTWRASNGAAANSLTLFAGLAEEFFSATFTQQTSMASNAGNPQLNVGIGINSTTAPTGLTSNRNLGFGNEGFVYTQASAKALVTPALGINTATAIEISQSNGNVSSNTFFGTQVNMQLDATWQG